MRRGDGVRGVLDATKLRRLLSTAQYDTGSSSPFSLLP
ncbi:hypothetical protein AKJ09_07493 [Labilithrix luteola]|uniref:Uncharacterized protein n=1 Tax=Labilithrix luteola TaxID=1391654 RepID=A0A0K1Q603_9BACT|nr:hypothetical protein AKJ09_07493 [Labilithrix luteola]